MPEKTALKRVPKPKLSDNQRNRFIAEAKTGAYSMRELARKYNIGTTQATNLIKKYAKNTTEIKQTITEEINHKKALLEIEEHKRNKFTTEEINVINEQVDDAVKYFKFTSNSLLLTQQLANIGTEQLKKIIGRNKGNPEAILKKLDELVKLNGIAARTHTSLHGKNNVSVQQNTQVNNNADIKIYIPDNERD